MPTDDWRKHVGSEQLVGDRISLRPLAETDLTLILRWRQSPDIAQYFFSPVPNDLDQQRDWFEKAHADPAQLNFIICRNSGGPVGMIALTHIAADKRMAELGRFIIGESEDRGARFGQEALTILLTTAFSEWHIRRARALVYAWNSRAIHVYTKYGFQIQQPRPDSDALSNPDVITLILESDDYFRRES